MSDLTPGPDHATGVDPAQPTTGPGFVARARKALVGGITGAIAGGAGTAVTSAIADGSIDGGEWYTIAGFIIGGFLLGAGAVYRVPNAPTGTTTV